MAGAELLLGRQERRGSGLYVYARETVGFALVIDGRVHSPTSGPGTVAGLPVQSELLGGSGQLESTVSDEAVVAAARRQRILPAAGPNSTIAALVRAARQDGSDGARELLAERARVLGGAVALMRDMLNPDDLVVGGQAFTEYPEGMDRLRSSFAERSLLGPREIRVSAFGNRVQEAGAGAVSLSSIYSDPLAALRRARQTAERRAV
jgi:predicted NBD/HSP70 family sugar kinase